MSNPQLIVGRMTSWLYPDLISYKPPKIGRYEQFLFLTLDDRRYPLSERVLADCIKSLYDYGLACPLDDAVEAKKAWKQFSE